MVSVRFTTLRCYNLLQLFVPVHRAQCTQHSTPYNTFAACLGLGQSISDQVVAVSMCCLSTCTTSSLAATLSTSSTFARLSASFWRFSSRFTASSSSARSAFTLSRRRACEQNHGSTPRGRGGIVCVGKRDSGGGKIRNDTSRGMLGTPRAPDFRSTSSVGACLAACPWLSSRRSSLQ